MAQQAKDALNAAAAETMGQLDALLAAAQKLTDVGGPLSAAAVKLGPDLKKLLKAAGHPGVPAAVRSSLAKAGTGDSR